jgi:hypothetical protein
MNKQSQKKNCINFLDSIDNTSQEEKCYLLTVVTAFEA